MDGGSFVEMRMWQEGLVEGAKVRSIVLHIVLVSFAEITDDLRISVSSNKSLFLVRVACRLSRLAPALSSRDSALAPAPCIFLVQAEGACPPLDISCRGEE